MTEIASFLKKQNALTPAPVKKNRGTSFIDYSLESLSRLISSSYFQWVNSSRDGYLQHLDPRVKTVFLFMFIVTTSLIHSPAALLLLCATCLILAIAGRIDLKRYLLQVLSSTLVFGLIISMPASLNFFTPGDPVINLINLQKEYTFWIYRIPAEISITRQGLGVVSMLTLRVASSVSTALLVLSLTAFTELIRSLKSMHMPDTFLLVMTMAYRHILLFALSAEEFYLALKSRVTGPVHSSQARGIIAGRVSIIFKKSMIRADEVYTAMRARGFDNTISLPGFARMKKGDAVIIFFIILFCAAIVYFQESI